nr:hypothetical protein [Verrucomicrobiae bacterium]
IYWNSQQILWPKPGLLVVSGMQGYWYPYYAIDLAGPVMARGVVAPIASAASGSMAVTPAARVGNAIMIDAPFFWPWRSSGGQLTAFDVSDPSAPRFKSFLNLQGTNAWWNVSQALTANGLVYVGHQSTEFLPGVLPAGQKPEPPQIVRDADGTLVTNQIPVGTWVQRYYLDVVDYADPATPTTRPPVNIPGALQGISADGSLIYTSGNHWDPVKFESDGTEWLDASAYDGVSAHLVDSVNLPASWPHPLVVAGDYVYVGQVADQSQTDQPPALLVWTLSSAGKWTPIKPPVPLDGVAQSLRVLGNLLAVQTSSANVELLDITTPTAVKSIGGGIPGGCLWFDLASADGSLANGLWLPLGAYGVAHIAPKP